MSKKIKCKQCKQYHNKEQIKTAPAGKFCSTNCILSFIQEKKEKEKLKMISKIYLQKGRKKGISNRDSKLNLKTRKDAAKKACHKYIRERDKYNMCICCNRRLGKVFHAGHFLESGNNPAIRYDEDNIHAQRLDCNKFKGGDSGFYRVNLIKKIGLKRVERLEGMKGGVIKRTAEDYISIEKYYNNKLIFLKNKISQKKNNKLDI